MMCNGMVCDGDEMFEHVSWLSARYSLMNKKDEQLKVESRYSK